MKIQNTVPQYTSEQIAARELMDKYLKRIEKEEENEWRQKVVAEGRERLRKEAAEKGLPEPKFVVLPFGDAEALEDYADEIWAIEAVKKYEREGKYSGERHYTLEEVKALLDSDLVSANSSQ